MEEEIFQQEAIQLLLDMLKIPSVNGINDERKMAWYIFNYLEKNKIPATLQAIDETHANVIAKLEGKVQNRSIIWNGHIDTVPYGNLEEWSTNPQTPSIINGSIFARGSSDMKSGLAAMLYALCHMKRSGYRPNNTILFLCTCDEEKDGLGASKFMEGFTGETNAQALIIGEPTGCQLGIAQKGCIWLSLILYGKTSHGAYPEQGINAVEKAFQIASEIKKYVQSFSHEILGTATAQITKIEGGIVPNMTPDKCRMLMDIRIVPEITKKMFCEKLESILEEFVIKSNCKLSYQYQIINDRKSVETASDNEWICRFRNSLLEEQDEVCNIGINYFTDASILTKGKSDLPVLLFGPGEPSMAHKPDEYVNIEKYLLAIRTLLKIFK